MFPSINQSLGHNTSYSRFAAKKVQSGRPSGPEGHSKDRFDKNKIVIGAKIGEGGYGKVYRCTDKDNKILAVKRVTTHPELGLPALMECSVMSVVHHPNVNRSLHIHATSEAMYIVQDIAESDLCHVVRTQTCNHDQIRRWIHGISQAISCLHRQDIIHGDVKASNVLIYKDGSVRLSDFTLATRMSWIRGYTPSRYYNICTSTHRPLEVWLGREWDLSVDIWALGCTLFQLVYGYSLFPPNTKQNKDQAINLLIDWGQRHPMAGDDDSSRYLTRSANYDPISLPEDWNNPHHILVNDLIMMMLQTDPSKRPTIIETLRHPYFTGMSVAPYMIVSTPINGLSSQHRSDIYDRASNLYHAVTFPIMDDVIALGIEIFVRSAALTDLIDHDRLLGSLWIAHKLIVRKTPPFETSSVRIDAIERVICAHLAFRLHTPISSPLIYNFPSRSDH